MLALDLGVFHRKPHAISLGESLAWTAVWVALALAFNAGVWHYAGSQKALEFFTGYLIEKSLSVDNIFVFAILGLRALYFALAGVMDKFHYLKIGLGVVLAFVGVKMLLAHSPYKLDTLASLGVIVTVLTVSVVASWLRPRRGGASVTPAGEPLVSPSK